MRQPSRRATAGPDCADPDLGPSRPDRTQARPRAEHRTRNRPPRPPCRRCTAGVAGTEQAGPWRPHRGCAGGRAAASCAGGRSLPIPAWPEGSCWRSGGGRRARCWLSGSAEALPAFLPLGLSGAGAGWGGAGRGGSGFARPLPWPGGKPCDLQGPPPPVRLLRDSEKRRVTVQINAS